MAIPKTTVAEETISPSEQTKPLYQPLSAENQPEIPLDEVNRLAGFGSSAIPDRVEMEREQLIPPDTNEVKAENQRDKLPQVNGWCVLIVPYSQPRMTRGGIAIPNKTVEVEERGTVIGYVVSLGSMAYKDVKKFGPNPVPWCKPGDYVVFGRYAGSRLTMRGEREEDNLACRILNDDEILAVVSNPADYVGVS